MPIIAVSSVAGSPGVTTATVATALAWPKPVLVVEADLSTTSRLLPGALRGQVPHTTGLTELAVADYHRRLDEASVWDQAIELTENVSLVPGFKSVRAGTSADNHFWRALVDALRVVEARGLDVLIDVGRLMLDDPRTELLREADSVTVVTGNTLPAIASVHAFLQQGDVVTGREEGWLRAELEQIGHVDRIDLVVTDMPHTGNTYPAREAAKTLGVRLLASLPWNTKGAGAYTFGVPNVPMKRNPYVRAAQSLARDLPDRISRRNADELGDEPDAIDAIDAEVER